MARFSEQLYAIVMFLFKAFFGTTFDTFAHYQPPSGALGRELGPAIFFMNLLPLVDDCAVCSDFCIYGYLWKE